MSGNTYGRSRATTFGMKLRLVLANAQHIWNVPGRKSHRKAGRARIYVGTTGWLHFQRSGRQRQRPERTEHDFVLSNAGLSAVAEGVLKYWLTP